MTLPAILFGLLISTLYGAVYHLLRGGGLGRLLLDLALAWAGFWLGQLIGSYLDWTFGSLGQLHLGLATLCSLIFLGLGSWLSRIETESSP